MKKIQTLIFFGVNVLFGNAQSVKENFPEYVGKDLGLTWTSKQSSFRVWAPTATKVRLKLYKDPLDGEAFQTIEMKKSINGTWTSRLNGNHLGTYYTFSILYKGQWLQEVPDPYAKAVGTNGKRAMVIDLEKTNPVGWAKDHSPLLTIPELAAMLASLTCNS